jgi:hypothetical protein
VGTAATVALSVTVTALVLGGREPSRATAQPGGLEEVRASSFVLVRADGTEIARIQPNSNGGGALKLYDSTGTERFDLQPLGFIIRDADGVTGRLGLGTNPLSGAPGINLHGPAGNVRITIGINPDSQAPFVSLRDPDGTTSRVTLGLFNGRSFLNVNDPKGANRVTVGQHPTAPDDAFQVAVRDGDGNVIATLP